MMIKHKMELIKMITKTKKLKKNTILRNIHQIIMQIILKKNLKKFQNLIMIMIMKNPIQLQKRLTKL